MDLIGSVNRSGRARAAAVSLLFHLLLLFLYGMWGREAFLPPPQAEEKTVTLELMPDQVRSREVVESPEGERLQEPDPAANLASDRNMTARDTDPRNTRGTLPASEGYTDVKDLPGAGGPGGVPADAGASSSGRGGEDSRRREESTSARDPASGSRAPEFSRNRLLGKNSQQSRPAGSRSSYDQRDSSAETAGGISFNTYEWDFAPYMLELKRRIERNIFPPPAFTHLGFGGENVLRFTILPDGTLEALRVLGSSGEEALVGTSKKAVEMSAPFLPLPADFPEKFLEVTANFKYFIQAQ